MKQHKIIFFFLFASLLLTLPYCKNYYTKVSNNDVSHLYNPSSTILHPQYRIYHKNDSISLLFFSISSTELLFNKKISESTYFATIDINYQLFNSYESGEIIDSATHRFKFEKPESSSNLIQSFEIKVKNGSILQARIDMKDVIRNKFHSDFIGISKKSVHSEQNFLPVRNDKTPIFNNFVTSKDSIFLENTRIKQQKYFVSFYEIDFNPALPPFSITPYKSTILELDSIWEITNNKPFIFPKYGMYHIQSDTSVNEGITFFNWGESFPEFTSPSSMLAPLRYLNSNKEFNKYEEFGNKKMAVDEFWLKAAGNPDRAREIIKVFYNRAIYANMYFSSFTEGWKTDRGMIYIIFGSPKRIYKTKDSEKWIYGDNPDLLSITFTFTQLENNYSSNDYILIRKEVYKTSWYQAVDTWRNGRIYSIGY
ncbi:MAG: GWxTD domain-containing protein [Bacteroidales bacterium]|nr:GWxTD domain-containing protein [Bacteroidales bacterium]